MTRNEEIKQAKIKYSNDTLFDGCDYIGQVAKQEAFIAGAKWADKAMIDKACEWLDKNITNYKSDMMGYIEYSQINDIIQDFRKAMEE